MGENPYHQLKESFDAELNQVVSLKALAMDWVMSDSLIGFGFFEVITESFYGKKMRDLIKIKSDDPLWSHIEVLNSREKDVAFLRRNCLPMQ